jgi:serine phosphatase RsbU (regulator of sigma subunit)
VKKVFVFLVILSATIPSTYSINKDKIDSLQNILNQPIHDTIRINTYKEIGFVYQYSIPDTAMIFYQKALDLVNKKIEEKKISIENLESIDSKYFSLKVSIYISIGIVYAIQGDYENGIFYHLKAIGILQETNDQEQTAQCFNNLGLIYSFQGNYESAIEYYLKSLKIRESTDNKADMGSTFLNIGNIHYAQRNYEKALIYYQKLLAISIEIEDKKSLSTSNLNIGVVYTQMGNYEKAMYHLDQSLKIQVELEDSYGLSHTYANFGDLHQKLGNDYEAKAYFIKSLKIRQETKDKKGIGYCYSGLSKVHNNISDSFKNQNNFKWKVHLDSALFYGKEAYKLYVEIGAVERQNEVSMILQDVYKELGNFKKALVYADIYISTRDSLFSEEKTKALAEMQTKYESEKKQQQIELQESQLLAKDERIKKQNLLRNALIIGLIGVLIIITLVIYAYQQKKKSNKEILKQKKQLTDSINYAAFIQKALLPDVEFLLRNFDEHFVFFKPRDQIGGDFYWVKQVNEFSIIAVADCTGHGVPGAMLSMLGMSLLNELVRREEIESPAQLLELLRAEIKASLKQESNSRSLRDGMDIAICAINNKTLQMQYAGANNPMFIFSNGQLDILKPTNNPIGIYLLEEQFVNHTIQLKKGDLLYMFSDGFYDQFGGENNKKFMINNFKKLLLQNSEESMKNQYKVLETNFNNWKGEGVQIDDVLVVGIKV